MAYVGLPDARNAATMAGLPSPGIPMSSLKRTWLTLLVGAATTLAVAQPVTTLSGERARVSYMVGMDVGRDIAPVGPDLDMAAFERAIRHAFAGGKPLLAEAEAKPLGQALMQRIGVRQGKAPAGTTLPAVSREKVGLLVGTDVGRSLAPIKQELDLAVLVQAMGTVLQGGQPLLTSAEADTLRTAFSARMQAQLQATARAAGEKNRAAGATLLAGNTAVRGVTTTPSGLQYMVLRQGAGPRPKVSDRVRVNYHGTLPDGRVFDSSYERGQPAEFMLAQVIKGWTEGVALMPVGSKYRFWIPSDLGYGLAGTPDGSIGPNSVLIFDVELLGILP